MTTMTKTNNLQEIFLTQARRERRPVTMFLMNGFQMRGYITGFDASTSTPFPPSCPSGPCR